jgi:hypothetical protein
MADQNQSGGNQEQKDRQQQNPSGQQQNPSGNREYQGERPMPGSSDDRGKSGSDMEEGNKNDNQRSNPDPGVSRNN